MLVNETDGLPLEDNILEKFNTGQYFFNDDKLYKHEDLNSNVVKVIDYKMQTISYITTTELEQVKNSCARRPLLNRTYEEAVESINKAIKARLARNEK